MFDSPVVNLIILLFFTYMVCSILVSSINEIIASIVSARSKDLKYAIDNLFLDGPENNKKWLDYVKQHIEGSPHFKSLQLEAGKYPSYIPAKNFAMAILDSFRDANGNIDMATVKITINKDQTIPEPLKKIITSFLDNTDTTVSSLEQEISDFYDRAMGRVSGLYKRKLSKWTFAVSFIMCVSLNIDTINIIKTSFGNPQQLQATADKIADRMASGDINYEGGVFTLKSNGGVATVTVSGGGAQQQASADTAAQPAGDTAATAPSPTLDKKISANVKNIKTVTVELQNTGTGFGYKSWKEFQMNWVGDDGFWAGIAQLLIKLAGIVLTSLAIQLGAPYWFDMLNRVVNIRNTGLKPGETKGMKK